MLQVADRADVVEAFLLTKDDPGGVVTSVFEPLQGVQKQWLTGSLSDVSDDPAHLELLPRL
jgi:hypothetical protein